MSIFNPKKYIPQLSENRLDAKLVTFLIIIMILLFSLSLFGFGGDGLRLIKETINPLGNIEPTERLFVTFKVITQMFTISIFYVIIYAVILIVLNWIIKKILSLFKREIKLTKMLNITLYSIFFNRGGMFIVVALFSLLNPFFNKISDNTWAALVLIPLININILSLVLYIYAVKISTKKKLPQLNLH